MESLPGSSKETPAGNEDEAELLYVDFSRTTERVATGTDNGFTIYKIRNVQQPAVMSQMFKRPFSKDQGRVVDDVILIECFNPIQMFAMVLKKYPRTLHFFDASRNTSTGHHLFPEKILSVKGCSSIIAVGLETEVHAFSICRSNFESLDGYSRLVKLSLPLNCSAVMDMTGEERPHLAYPDSDTNGIVAVHDIDSRSYPKRVMNAHNHPIAALRFNDEATLLATASTIATVVRVHDVRKNECLFVFRRGIARSVTVHSMAFSSDSVFLCLSSNTETVHVFKLEGPLPKVLQLEEEVALKTKPISYNAEPPGWYDYLADTTRSAAEYLAPARDFASAFLPETAKRNVATLRMIDDKLHILVANSKKKFFVFEVQAEGGTALLKHELRLPATVLIN
uniref:WD repeat domain phosphoinositide-interacting protein 2 n=1 Tax=Setaria digitata TaxID=48799 RepID=A0A915PIS5_9BILA